MQVNVIVTDRNTVAVLAQEDGGGYGFHWEMPPEQAELLGNLFKSAAGKVPKIVLAKPIDPMDPRLNRNGQGGGGNHGN